MKVILVRDMGWGVSWCDLNLTFNFAFKLVILTIKIFLGYISETVRYRKLVLGGNIGW